MRSKAHERRELYNFDAPDLAPAGLWPAPTRRQETAFPLENSDGYLFGPLIPSLVDTEVFGPICQGIAKAGAAAGRLYHVAATLPKARRVRHFMPASFV